VVFAPVEPVLPQVTTTTEAPGVTPILATVTDIFPPVATILSPVAELVVAVHLTVGSHRLARLGRLG